MTTPPPARQNPLTTAALTLDDIRINENFAVIRPLVGIVLSGFFTSEPFDRDHSVDPGYFVNAVTVSDNGSAHANVLSLTWMGICPDTNGNFGELYTITPDDED